MEEEFDVRAAKNDYVPASALSGGVTAKGNYYREVDRDQISYNC